MKKTFFLLGWGLFSPMIFAKNPNFQSFIPKKFNLLESQCHSDFNQDGQKDCVLIIQATQKSAWKTNFAGDKVNRNRRGIVILFKTPHSYQKVLENQSLFASENEDGGIYFAPELMVESQKNQLIFRYGHGRYGHWSYTFDYRKINQNQKSKDFYLIGFDVASHRGAKIEYTQSVNFLTQKFRHQINLNENDNGENPKLKTTWYTLPKQPLYRLAKIQDIDQLGMTLNEQLYSFQKKNP